MKPRELAVWLRGYRAGFEASYEGWNGEYPFRDKARNPEADASWVKRRYVDFLAEKEHA